MCVEGEDVGGGSPTMQAGILVLSGHSSWMQPIRSNDCEPNRKYTHEVVCPAIAWASGQFRLQMDQYTPAVFSHVHLHSCKHMQHSMPVALTHKHTCVRTTTHPSHFYNQDPHGFIFRCRLTYRCRYIDNPSYYIPNKMLHYQIASCV